MRIPVIFGTVIVGFESKNPISWAVRREVKRILYVNGKADKTRRIEAIKKFRQMTGSGLIDAVKYTNKFFPPSDRVGSS